MNLFDHAPDALLGRPHTQIGSASRPFIHPPERIAQEVELTFRNLTDSRLFLVDGQLQLSHELAHAVQSFVCLTPPAQDHEIIRVGHDSTA
jgi:hypothetical protein